MPANITASIAVCHARPLPQCTKIRLLRLLGQSGPTRLLGPQAAASRHRLPALEGASAVSQSVDPTATTQGYREHRVKNDARAERTLRTVVCWPQPAARSGGSVGCSTW